MRIFIDGDACPQKEEILTIANKYNKEVLIFVDYAHEIDTSLYHEVIVDDTIVAPNRIKKEKNESEETGADGSACRVS